MAVIRNSSHRFGALSLYLLCFYKQYSNCQKLMNVCGWVKIYIIFMKMHLIFCSKNSIKSYSNNKRYQIFWDTLYIHNFLCKYSIIYYYHCFYLVKCISINICTKGIFMHLSMSRVFFNFYKVLYLAGTELAIVLKESNVDQWFLFSFRK